MDARMMFQLASSDGSTGPSAFRTRSGSASMLSPNSERAPPATVVVGSAVAAVVVGAAAVVVGVAVQGDDADDLDSFHLSPPIELMALVPSRTCETRGIRVSFLKRFPRWSS
jgi:hypothetical protein